MPGIQGREETERPATSREWRLAASRAAPGVPQTTPGSARPTAVPSCLRSGPGVLRLSVKRPAVECKARWDRDGVLSHFARFAEVESQRNENYANAMLMQARQRRTTYWSL